MSSPRPAVDSERAERIATSHFGVRAMARELPAELDRNYLLQAEDGNRYVMKI